MSTPLTEAEIRARFPHATASLLAANVPAFRPVARAGGKVATMEPTPEAQAVAAAECAVQNRRVGVGPAAAEDKKRALEDEFAALWRNAGGSALVREHEFHPARKWKFDFALIEARIAIEIEGLVHGGRGRHQTVSGAKEDAEKYLSAWLLGWTVLRLTRAQVTPDHISAVLGRINAQSGQHWLHAMRPAKNP